MSLSGPLADGGVVGFVNNGGLASSAGPAAGSRENVPTVPAAVTSPTKPPAAVATARKGRGAGHGEQQTLLFDQQHASPLASIPGMPTTGAGGLATGQGPGGGSAKGTVGGDDGSAVIPGAPTEVSSIPHVVPAGLGGVAPAASGGITISAAAIPGASVPGAAIPGTGSGAPGAGIAGGETASAGTSGGHGAAAGGLGRGGARQDHDPESLSGPQARRRPQATQQPQAT